jgi:hypothetical protein
VSIRKKRKENKILIIEARTGLGRGVKENKVRRMTKSTGDPREKRLEKRGIERKVESGGNEAEKAENMRNLNRNKRLR